jgi:hypothetical protein
MKYIPFPRGKYSMSRPQSILIIALLFVADGSPSRRHSTIAESSSDTVTTTRAKCLNNDRFI